MDWNDLFLAQLQWNLLFCEQDSTDKYLFHQSKNNPKEDGDYLCTCLRHFSEGKDIRYLRMMRYDIKDGWYDIGGTPHHISHNILAWTDGIEPCDAECKYIGGGIIVKK